MREGNWLRKTLTLQKCERGTKISTKLHCRKVVSDCKSAKDFFRFGRALLATKSRTVTQRKLRPVTAAATPPGSRWLRYGSHRDRSQMRRSSLERIPGADPPLRCLCHRVEAQLGRTL